jgi:hypothetical protein
MSVEAECRETERLLRRAWSLGLEVPNDPTWWEDDFEENIESGASPQDLEFVGHRWLSAEGKLRLTFRIEEAEIKKQNADLDLHLKKITIRSQRVSIFVGVGGVLVGLIGAAIALITFIYH